ncbi:hypothetical protein ACP70R_008982 [Stipagrostis hirtigluma subsp. patula]
MPQTPSTRWCPTPEQLMILEEMYRSGVRTPNAAEIQQITAHLAYYGRIEGKNVFYWFQNHKARERQRLRRRLCARHQQQYAQQTALAAPPPPLTSSPTTPPNSNAAAGVHPPAAVMQLHHHHQPYYAATNCFMPQQGYPGQQAVTPPVAYPAAAVAGVPVNLAAAGEGKMSGTAGHYGVAAMMCNTNSQCQEEWAGGEQCNANCSAAATAAGGSSDDLLQLPPCCRRPPLRTLELFPTKSTGLRDECSSSKSSSCSTSTN